MVGFKEQWGSRNRQTKKPQRPENVQYGDCKARWEENPRHGKGFVCYISFGSGGFEEEITPTSPERVSALLKEVSRRETDPKKRRDLFYELRDQKRQRDPSPER